MLQPRTGLRTLAVWEPLSLCPLSHNSGAEGVTLGLWYRGLPLVHPPPSGVSSFTQPDAHQGPSGKRPAVLLCLPAQNTGTLAGLWLSPSPLSPYTPQHTHTYTHTTSDLQSYTSYLFFAFKFDLSLVNHFPFVLIKPHSIDFWSFFCFSETGCILISFL